MRASGRSSHRRGAARTKASRHQRRSREVPMGHLDLLGHAGTRCPCQTVPRMLMSIGLAAMLFGCAAFSTDSGISAVQDIAGATLEQTAIARRGPNDEA